MKKPKYLKKVHPLKKLSRRALWWYFRNRMELFGTSDNIKGPAVIACTHHLFTEFLLLDSIFKDIYWISDLSWWIGKKNKRIRPQSIPVVKQVLNRMGYIELNRKKTKKFKPLILHKSITVLENCGIVGIMPAGGTDKFQEKVKVGNKGAAFIAQQASLQLNKKVPIYPVGVKKKNGKYTIKIGEPIFPNPNGDSLHRSQITEEVMESMEKLAE